MFSFFRITIFGVIFVIIVLVWTFVFGLASNQPGSFFNSGHNAVWIGHEWVGEEKTDIQIQELVNTLKNHQIDTVFVHVGPINSSGSVDPETYKYSLGFLEKAKSFEEDINYQAWLGQIRRKLDLADESVRHNISNLSIILADVVGFDGIHFDIEPVWDGDGDFIKLLAEVRDDLGEEKKISVALAELIPQSILWLSEHVYSFENYNSEVNFSNVAKYADQVVAMVYDLGFESEWFYRWIVTEQTIRITDLLEGTEVFIAIPSYDEEKEGFSSEVENVKNGLRGIIKGLNNFRSNENNFAGVAIYPYWEIDEEEWRVYDDLWLK